MARWINLTRLDCQLFAGALALVLASMNYQGASGTRQLAVVLFGTMFFVAWSSWFNRAMEQANTSILDERGNGNVPFYRHFIWIDGITAGVLALCVPIALYRLTRATYLDAFGPLLAVASCVWTLCREHAKLIDHDEQPYIEAWWQAVKLMLGAGLVVAAMYFAVRALQWNGIARVPASLVGSAQGQVEMLLLGILAVAVLAGVARWLAHKLVYIAAREHGDLDEEDQPHRRAAPRTRQDRAHLPQRLR